MIKNKNVMQDIVMLPAYGYGNVPVIQYSCTCCRI